MTQVPNSQPLREYPTPVHGLAAVNPRRVIIILTMAWRAAIGVWSLTKVGGALGEVWFETDHYWGSQTTSYDGEAAHRTVFYSWIGVIYLGLACYPRLVHFCRSEPRTTWLRSSCATMAMLLCAAPLVHPGPGRSVVVAVMVLIDWLLVGRVQLRTRWWEPLVSSLTVVAAIAVGIPLIWHHLGLDYTWTVDGGWVIIFVFVAVHTYVLYGLLQARKGVHWLVHRVTQRRVAPHDELGNVPAASSYAQDRGPLDAVPPPPECDFRLPPYIGGPPAPPPG